MAPGNKYQLTLKNVANPGIERYGTAIHTHGLHISPEGSSDNMTRSVEPGKCLTYTWAIPSDHMGGTHWYYATKHPDTQIQIHGGAFGVIIIEDQPNLLGVSAPPSFEAWQSKELILLASKLEQEANPYYFVDLYLGNGRDEAVWTITANEWYRLRVVGMEQGGRPGVIDFSSGCQVHAMAVDGVWFSRVPMNTVSQSKFDMISRMDFAIQCAAGSHGINFFGGKVAVLNADASLPPSQSHPFPSGPWTPARPTYLQDLLSWTGPVKNHTFHLIDGYINNASWCGTTPMLNLDLGDVVEWTLKGTSTAAFHLQAYPMQVVSEDGTCGWHKKGEFYDVIAAVTGDVGVALANHAITAFDGPPCTVRARLSDVGGRVVFMAKYLELADGGTRAWANVSGAPAADTTRLDVEECLGAVCTSDGSCTPEYECGSYYGRDNCGGPCNLNASAIPNCTTSNKPICDTDRNRCVRKLRPVRIQSLTKAKTVKAMQTTLLTLPWNSTGCEATYDFCGEIDFCAVDNGIVEYAYRLPGQPCRPAKSPVIRMLPGKKYMLTMHNRGVPGLYEHKANIHTHGIHVRGDGNADDVTRVCPPGYSLKFTYDIPDYHQGGTFWYHDHKHYLTKAHVAGGAFGMLLIEDPADFSLDSSFNLWLKNEVLLIASRVGDIYLGNGNANEQLYLTADEWYRLRVVGVDPEAKPKDLIVGNSNCEVHRMQHDGVWNTKLPANLRSDNTWTMSGASRVEMAIRCRAGSHPILWFGGRVATLVVTSGANSVADPWVEGYGNQWDVSAKRPAYLQSLRSYTGPIEKYTFTIKHGFINDLPWNEHVPIHTVPFNTIVEWTFRGTSIHAYHLHIWHMQVVTPGGCGYHEEGQWYDTIARNDGGDCTVRLQLRDHSGRTVLHCHYLEHEDMGTMAWVNVTGGPPADMAFVEPEPTPDMYTPSLSADVAIYGGSHPMGNVNLEMAGRILSFTVNTTRFTDWRYTKAAIYAGVKPVPMLANGEPDLSLFRFTMPTSLGVTAYTFSDDIANLGVTCPSMYPATLQVAVWVQGVNTTGETRTGWALGKQLVPGKDATSFKFTPSCAAPTLSPILMRNAVASFGRTFTVQVDPASMGLKTLNTGAVWTFALVPASSAGVFSCSGTLSFLPTTFSEDKRALVLIVPPQSAGLYGVCVLSSGVIRKVSSTLRVTGPTTTTLRGAQCLTDSNPQQVSQSETLALEVAGVELHPSDVWWVVEAGKGCQAQSATQTHVRSDATASASVRGLSGQLALCYQHQGIIAEVPLCVSVTKDVPSNDGGANLMMYVIPAAVCAALLLALVGGLFWWRRRPQEEEMFLPVSDKDEETGFPSGAAAPVMVTPVPMGPSSLVSPATVRVVQDAFGGAATPSQRLHPSMNVTPRLNTPRLNTI